MLANCVHLKLGLKLKIKQYRFRLNTSLCKKCQQMYKHYHCRTHNSDLWNNSHISYITLCFSGIRVTRSFVLCVMFCRSLFVLVSFFFCHCVVCPSWFTDSDYPFGIFKLFSYKEYTIYMWLFFSFVTRLFIIVLIGELPTLSIGEYTCIVILFLIIVNIEEIIINYRIWV